MRDYRFGTFLRELRVQTGLSQYQLGMLVGVSDKAISKWENGISKPKSRILYRLSEILGVRVDTLLSCGYSQGSYSVEKGDATVKNELWKKAYAALLERYDNLPPPQAANRYFSEYEELKAYDTIIFFDFLAQLSENARRNNEYLCTNGVIASSYVAYIMGATDIDPLEANYYCPRCKKGHFVDSISSGWDLPRKNCSCGCVLERNGHHIPFESLRIMRKSSSAVDICVSHSFYEETITLMKHCFKDNKLLKLKKENSDIGVFVILPYAISEFSDGQELNYNMYNEQLRAYPHLTITRDQNMDVLHTLSNRSGMSLYNIDYLSGTILDAMISGNTDGIPGFGSDFIKNMIHLIKPTRRYALIQVCGLAHGTGVWKDNAEQLLKEKGSVSDVIAYREDVFNYIQQKMKMQGISNTGLAYKIMEDVRRGVYARHQLPDEIKETLIAIGAEDWFIASLQKIQYLFPKSHGVESVRFAMLMMWYKLHDPQSFSSLYAENE